MPSELTFRRNIGFSPQLTLFVNTSPELEVAFWEYGTFLDPQVEGPAAVVPAHEITSQACRVTLRRYPCSPSADEEDEDDDLAVPPTSLRADNSSRLWATIGLTRVSGDLINDKACMLMADC